MASVMQNKDDNKAMADDELDHESDDAAERRRLNYSGPAPKAKEAGGGFFQIYKSGQGYWTRMLTAGGAVLIIGLTAQFLYRYAMVGAPPKIKAIVASAFCLLAGALTWWLMNKPTNADFLISTDSEMKKVNWTSRQELIGSTKVVIFFMFMIATLLFLTDVFFGYFFKWIQVLKQSPFG